MWTAASGILRYTDRSPCPWRQLGSIASDRRLSPALDDIRRLSGLRSPSVASLSTHRPPQAAYCCSIGGRSSQSHPRHLNSELEFLSSTSCTSSPSDVTRRRCPSVRGAVAGRRYSSHASSFTAPLRSGSGVSLGNVFDYKYLVIF